mmetsp:Transcript_22315/g.56785  ORF Transcript_22315/g.56785 Transcript_22315/m.56785 type:complete len:272 (-) Transcript_22315:789-1604(-)|eukprot:CAMPEP_0202867698 /NCGR_PEP_ID=MMETSP1391-20130828/9576_1 /ASSEMBLY_ACC=CAM_ASM_000867 /TAXON_ID=1034604 /ORGANISM="Chlamydomonas leiostraca, Strain SAG 11-49" /LENGTH=271 /DNA_ID=CAMNT_0049547761 /DNA_START=52 /DNA_END=867 /DNA_ORIENTATION=+
MSDPDGAAAPTQDDRKLCDVLRAASRRIHDRSNSLVNARLIVLFTDRRLYGRALACFYHVFQALESALDACAKLPEMSRFAATLSPAGLYRTAGFEADLQFYLGDDWRQQVSNPSPAILAYTDHLVQLGAAQQVSALLAHAYTQHLALASGGQVIKRMARRHMQLPEDQGTAAFDYASSSPAALKAAFVGQLDAHGAALDAEAWDNMVHEHRLAFAHNNAIIRAFRLGWWPFFRGLFRLVPPMLHVTGVLLLAVLVYLLFFYQRGGAAATA